MASSHLNKTFGAQTTAGRKTWTFSAWIRRARFTTSQNIIWSDAGSSNYERYMFDNSEKIYMVGVSSGSTAWEMTTTRVFRDPAAWYHIMIVRDTTQGSAANRLKLYINGEQETSFSTNSPPAQDYTGYINSTNEMRIGKGNTAEYFDGQMTHINFVDSAALAPANFGETDATTGIWKPKPSPTGVTYGTNGFFLKMDNSANMGLDSSGQGNNWTVNGTILQVRDTPSNIFSTINAVDQHYFWGTDNNNNMTNFNTTVQTGNSQYGVVGSSLGVSKGKYYWEVKPFNKNGGNDSELMIGVTSTFPQSAGHTLGYYPNDVGYRGNGTKQINNSQTSYGNAYAINDIIGVAMDLDNNKIYFSKNGVFQNSGVPTSGSTGTGAISLTDPDSTERGFYMPSISFVDQTYHAKFHLNMGLGFFGTTAVSSPADVPDDGIGAFEYDVPAGYRALCTKSINEEEYS